MSQAVELQEASKEITMLRDLLTDLWLHAHPQGRVLSAGEERLWARVEVVVTEGQYGWDRSLTLEDLSRRVSKIEMVLQEQAEVRLGRDVRGA